MEQSTHSSLFDERTPRRWLPAKEKLVPWLVGSFIVINVLSRILLNAPLIRAMELGFCREHYLEADPSVIEDNGYVEEKLCKVNEVQEALATLRGWFVAIDSMLGLINAIPMLHFGQICDRRKLVLTECAAWFTGSVFTYCVCYFNGIFPMWALYFATLPTLIGGTAALALSFLYAILAESLPVSSLSEVFFYISAGLFISRVLAFSATAWMMQISIALPVSLGFVTYVLSLPLVLLVAEPRSQSAKDFMALTPDMNASRSSASFAAAAAEEEEDDDDGCEPDTLSASQHLQLDPSEPLLRGARRLLAASVRLVRTFYVQCPTAAYCLALFFLYKLGTCAMDFVAQWSSNLFAFSLAAMNYVHSYSELVGGLTLVALSSAVKLLRARLGLSSLRADAAVVQASAVACALGTLLLALSDGRTSYFAGLAVIKLSSGFHDALKAYATALTPSDYITTFYLGVSVAETAALTLGEPAWAGAINAGFDGGGNFSRGLFVLSAVIVALTGLGLWRLRA